MEFKLADSGGYFDSLLVMTGLPPGDGGVKPSQFVFAVINLPSSDRLLAITAAATTLGLGTPDLARTLVIIRFHL